LGVKRVEGKMKCKYCKKSIKKENYRFVSKKEWKKRKFCSNKCQGDWTSGKTYEKIMSPDKCKKMKQLVKKSLEERFGKKRSRKMRENLSKKFKGKAFEELYGNKAKRMRLFLQRPFVERLRNKNDLPKILEVKRIKMKKHWSNSNFRKKQSLIAINLWKNESFRKRWWKIRQTKAFKQKVSVAIKKALANPITKAKQREARLLQVVPCKDTGIEVKLQNDLKKRGVKFTKHVPILGQPDLFVEPNICVFADGNYWHSYPYRTERDIFVNKELKKQGYRVLRFWEHEINNNVVKCVDKIIGVM